jgi:hypothetical protein
VLCERRAIEQCRWYLTQVKGREPGLISVNEAKVKHVDMPAPIADPPCLLHLRATRVTLLRCTPNICDQKLLRYNLHQGFMVLATHPCTTLADLLTPLLVANPFSAMRTSVRWWSSDEFEDGMAHDWQSRLGRWPVVFFSRPAVERQCWRKTYAIIVMSA